MRFGLPCRSTTDRSVSPNNSYPKTYLPRFHPCASLHGSPWNGCDVHHTRETTRTIGDSAAPTL
jgi:hypothetical protein